MGGPRLQVITHLCACARTQSAHAHVVSVALERRTCAAHVYSGDAANAVIGQYVKWAGLNGSVYYTVKRRKLGGQTT